MKTTKKELALIAVFGLWGEEMRKSAGWRENDVMNRAEDFQPEKDGNRNFIITLYTGPGPDGRRESAQYHTGRHTWTRRKRRTAPSNTF